MTAPLPQPDAEYARDIDRAFAARGRKILALLGPYAREPDMHKARLDFNRAARNVDPEFAADIQAAQDALRRRHRPVAACEACGLVMDLIEPGQRYHPMCEPETPPLTLERMRESSQAYADPAPAPSGAPAEDEDW